MLQKQQLKYLSLLLLCHIYDVSASILRPKQWTYTGG